MITEVGTILLGLSLLVSLYMAGASFHGIRRADSRWAQSGRNAANASAALLGLAFLALLIAFMSNDFRDIYVGRSTPVESCRST